MARVIQIGPGGGIPTNPAREPEDAPPRRVVNGIQTTMRAPTVHGLQGSGTASVVFPQSERRISGVLYNSTGATVYVGTAETDDSEWFPVANGATYQHDSQSLLLAVAEAGATLPLSGLHTAEDRN